MATTVCVDALVYWNGTALGGRNDASITQDVEVAEAKPFVASMSAAYANKLPSWKSWKATLSGYYDDADETVQNAISAGTVAQLVVYPTRSNLNNYWYGDGFVSSCEHTMNS